MIRQNPLDGTMKFMLTLSGAWPGASSALFWRMFFIVSVIIAQCCRYRYVVIHMHSATLSDFMDCLSVALANCKVLFKCLVLWLNQPKFIEVLTIMKKDWSDCVNDDISMRMTASKAKTSERITRIILILHTMSVVSFSIGVILANVDVTNNTTELIFLTKIEVPFDVNTQRTYRFILLIELCFIFMMAWSSGTTNSLLLILTLHTAGQIDILRYWLTQLTPSGNVSKDESLAAATTKIIEKHKKIICFSKNIESLYTHIALVQFVSNTLMICALAFLVVTTIGSPNATKQIVRSFFFFVITNLEAYIFCFAGEYLKNKNKEIGFAAYNSAWYDMKTKDSRVLLFIMLRSQKQLTLTAGKMMDLSLQSFTSIINASGSFLSMLLAMR
ncbi:odorant receptor 4-like [Temnothorax nylanderi]|uniref:odorant receptor 4-like n=1 Tax=Temnothorax nylanderi TaxID=102681 RepID=UPI003A8C481B